MYLPLLQLIDCDVYTIDREKRLLCNVNLTIEENQFYVMVGQNGAGKSTLLSVIQHEMQKYILVGKRETKIDFIPLLSQQIEHYFVGQSAWEELVLSYETAFCDKEVTQQDMITAINQVVDELDLRSILHQPLHQLSGGQQQLIALASVLLCKLPLVLIDEMTTMLDRENRAIILQKIRAIQAKFGCTMIYVTHDEQEILATDKVITINNQKVSLKTYDEWYKVYKLEMERKQEIRLSTDNLPLHITHAENVQTKQRLSTIVVSSLVMDYSTMFSKETYRFDSGKVTLIKGKNGAGKSTLLKAIAGESKPIHGHIYFAPASHSLNNRKAINTVSKHISYCPQFLSHYWAKDTIRDECLFVLKCHHLLEKFKDENEVEAYVLSYLSYFGLQSDAMTTNIHNLSVGQQRKLALALCFMVNKNWILLDEPYAYLDDETKYKLSRLIEHRVQQGCGVILISHEDTRIAQTPLDVIELTQQIESGYLNVDVDEVDAIPIKKEKQHEYKLSHKLHPLFIIGILLVTSLIIFLKANVMELCGLFIVIALLYFFIIKHELLKMMRTLFMFTLYMTIVGVVVSFDFTQAVINIEKLLPFLVYTLKLSALLMLAFPMMNFVSPFRLMRALQQMAYRYSKVKGEYLYSIVILFKFIALLQRLWFSLSLLYSTKYKTNFARVLVSFLVQYIRESLLMAESIIINYELRKPLQSKLLLYRVVTSKLDYVVISVVLIICLLISIV